MLDFNRRWTRMASIHVEMVIIVEFEVIFYFVLYMLSKRIKAQKLLGVNTPKCLFRCVQKWGLQYRIHLLSVEQSDFGTAFHLQHIQI